jgi:hypothetical protein
LKAVTQRIWTLRREGVSHLEQFLFKFHLIVSNSCQGFARVGDQTWDPNISNLSRGKARQLVPRKMPKQGQ